MEQNMNEIREFQIMIVAVELCGMYAPTEQIADELILLAASYGPPRNSMTETD